MSLVAYGAFALACIAGVMYLVRSGNSRLIISIQFFSSLPP